MFGMKVGFAGAVAGTAMFFACAAQAQTIEETAGFLITGVPLGGTLTAFGREYTASFIPGASAGKGRYKMRTESEAGSDASDHLVDEFEVAQIAPCKFELRHTTIWLPGASFYNKVKGNRDTKIQTFDFTLVSEIKPDGERDVTVIGPQWQCYVHTPTDIKCSDRIPLHSNFGGARKMLAAFEHMNKNFCQRRAF